MPFLFSSKYTIIIIEVFTIKTLNCKGCVVPYALVYTQGVNTHYYLLTELTREEIASFILNSFDAGYIYYAHNLAFDFFLFFEGFLRLGVKYSWVYINFLLYEVKFFYQKKTITLRCSYRLLPFKLASFYPAFTNTQKLPVPDPLPERASWELPCHLYKEIESQYSRLTLAQYFKICAITDCQILKESLYNFFSSLAQLQIPYKLKSYTCSSIAFNFYVQKWNKINFKLPLKIKNLIRQAYFGGRCEVYGNPRPNEKILHFDFSGMYQNCMTSPLPYGDFEVIESNFNLEEPGFYYIQTTYFNYLPVLPSRADKVYFKEGGVSGWFWHEEILTLIKYCEVVELKIIYGLRSQATGPILEEFVQTLGKLRTGGELKKNIGKLLINSFYGRLAIDESMDLIFLKTDSTSEDYSMRCGLSLIKKKIKKKTQTNIAMAAAITAKARIKLYEAQQEILAAGGRLLYSDTDSIFASFNPNMPVENRVLGKHVYFDTQKEDTTIVDAVFISPKTYGLRLKNNQEIIKIKGVVVSDISFKNLKEEFYAGKSSIQVARDQIIKNGFFFYYSQQSVEVALQGYSKRK